MQTVEDIWATLYRDHPELLPLKTDIDKAFEILLKSFQGGNKLLLCGNGGSACDCEHIAGELMKGFLLSRPMNPQEQEVLAAAGDSEGLLAKRLQRALPTIVLQGLSGMSSAFLNDVDGELTYAQQAFAYAKPGDVMLGISTSGNAKNVNLAAIAAHARGAMVIGLTGESGGKLLEHCDLCLRVPQRETWRIQELHLPLYHALCAALEQAMFGEG